MQLRASVNILHHLYQVIAGLLYITLHRWIADIFPRIEEHAKEYIVTTYGLHFSMSAL